MSSTERSPIYQAHPELGPLTTRQSSVSSSQVRRKGLSLSKQHDPSRLHKSNSFITLLQKVKKPVNFGTVERREIKLLLKVKEDPSLAHGKIIGKENSQTSANTGAKPKPVFMDTISANKPAVGKPNLKEFGMFPMKKSARKERGIPQQIRPCIQLF